jgi:dienelactone hydrolase
MVSDAAAEGHHSRCRQRSVAGGTAKRPARLPALTRTAAIGILALLPAACSPLPRPQTAEVPVGRAFTTSVSLHGKPLELHVSKPRMPAAPGMAVLYASGDGGWFGAAVDMFRKIADAGYPVVGFSSRAFLKIERPRGAPLVSAAQLAAEYEDITAQARIALGLDDSSRVVLTGWSRGAAFSVLVASEPKEQDHLLGVVAIGLGEGEDLTANGDDDESDDGHPSEPRHWPFDTYARIEQVAPLPCAVIQATMDNYFPAAIAHRRFGADTPLRRFYTIDAKNHRFSGGKAAFDTALIDAIRWIVSQPVGGSS